MLKRLLIGIVLLIAAFLVVVWFQPDNYRLTRSTTIMAPAEAVFARVNDLRQWDDWSPWAKLDPNAKVSFEGPPAGRSAMFHWSGNSKIGAGTMTITDSKPNERVATRTDFVKPFEGTSDAEFIFSGTGNQTSVIWTMTGKQDFIAKAMCLFMPMETMLGPEFEKGLAALKDVSERK